MAANRKNSRRNEIASARKWGLTAREYRRRKEAGLKGCTKCRRWKPESDFGSNASRTDGLAASCKMCRAEIERERREAAKTKACETCGRPHD